jgi:cyclase
MLAPRVIPVLQIDHRRLVKTVRFGDARYVGDPINAVRIFNRKEVDELILLDLTATTEAREPQFDFIQEIVSEAFMPVCYGGGVRSVAQMERLFKLGVEKVSLGSEAATEPRLVKDAAKNFGSQSVVVCIDHKSRLFGGPKVVTQRGRRDYAQAPADFARSMEDCGAGEILLQSVDRDGTMKGYDLPLLAEVTARVRTPVVACGGAGSLDDFAAAIRAGAAGVAAGSFFVFQGKLRAVLISYPSREDLARLAATVPIR